MCCHKQKIEINPGNVIEGETETDVTIDLCLHFEIALSYPQCYNAKEINDVDLFGLDKKQLNNVISYTVLSETKQS